MLSAQPSSRSMRCGSNDSACHISSWLIAVAGTKLLPARNGCVLYQSFAFCVVQRAVCAQTFGTTDAHSRSAVIAGNLVALRLITPCFSSSPTESKAILKKHVAKTTNEFPMFSLLLFFLCIAESPECRERGLHFRRALEPA